MTRKEKAREYAKKWRSVNAVTPEQKAAIAAINKRNYHKRKEILIELKQTVIIET